MDVSTPPSLDLAYPQAKAEIPYASTKVNNYAMKLYPTCDALFGVNYA